MYKAPPPPPPPPGPSRRHRRHCRTLLVAVELHRAGEYDLVLLDGVYDPSCEGPIGRGAKGQPGKEAGEGNGMGERKEGGEKEL